MADTQLTTEALRDATSTPIAQLNPGIDSPQTRAVQGVITIIWPFSIVTKSIAFILAEPDFRLRRENGQVRLRFHGASAKAIADAKLGGGDEVRLSLQGTRWERNETETQLAGSTLEWQLEFTNRLFLSVQRAGEGEEALRVIDVDVPEVDEVVTNGTTADIETNEHQSNADLAIPIPQSPEPSLPSKRPVSPNLEAQELASPAFIKRARLSYGSLFEGGFDIFDEPQTRRKKKSKRPARFSLPANSWRYSSRSPSPEVEEIDGELEESDREEESNHAEAQKDTADVPMPTPTRPEMVDGGCQTDDVDFTPMASVQVSAEARPTFGFPYATPTPLPRSRPEDMTQAHPLNFQVGGPTSQEPVIQDPTNFHTPAHLDPSLDFSFVSPQPNMFGGPNFSHAQDVSMGTEHIQHHPQTEQYAATFLDNQTQPSTASHSFHSVHEDVEPHGSERPHVHFQPEPQFYPPFEEEGLTQPSREEWPTSQFTAANTIQNPADFINSSPVGEQDAPTEERSTSARSPSAPSEQEEAIGLQEILDKRPEYDREEQVEEPPTEEQGFYKDGGDRPGDDYDLRNYDRAHDDDDDVVGSSEESPDIGTDDPDAQIINPEEDSVDEEDDNIDEDVDDYERGEYGEYEGEGEYYSDEEMYDEEDEEEGESEEEYDEPPPRPAAPKAPVFISLLSDSEDEDEAEPEPKPASQPEPQRAEEPRPGTEPESEPQSEEESDSGEETGSEDELPTAPPREVEQVPEVEEPQSPEGPQSPADESEGSMKSDDDEDLAEDTVLIGQEPPSEDRMEVDGDQSPELSVRSPESKASLQASQETRPVNQEENESASLSIERGVPANEDHGDLARANIAISVVEMEVAPATPQQSKGDEQVQDEIQVSEVVKVEEIVTTSGDAMEVDDTQVVQPEEGNRVAGIETASANDTAAVVQPTGGTLAEDTTTGMENHEEPINVEATNVVEVLAEIVVAQRPESSLPSASNVDDQRTPQVEEDITEKAPETQGSGPTRSPDATLQETFQLATTEHRPSDKAPGSQSDHGESYEDREADEDQHNTPFSPPPTQVSQSQISKDDEAALLSEAPATTSTHNIDGNLPTPHDTQQDAEMSAHYPAEEYHGTQGEDAQGGPDNQIIEEFLQHSPERLEGIQKTSPAEVGVSPIKAEPTGVLDEEKPWQGEHGSEVPSTAKALRSRGHRATRSSDLNKASQQDPGVESARAPHPHGDDEKYSSPRNILRVTRSRADVPDPSSQMARASQVAEDSKGSSHSPTGTIRVTRSMTEHSDTTSALAKGSSPSARQSRRQHTPEVPHRETRASSRSFMKSDSPDVNESMLQSPSVRSVGGSSTVEDENANALKLQLLKSLRTSMPEYLSLKSLRNSLNKTVDMLAVATTTPAQPQRPKGGPRDYMLSLNLTDPSTAPASVVVANLFRPHQASLPVVHAGDIVLLRRVQVVSMKNRGFGVRTGDSSAWAVFEKGDPEMLPQIKGPPVETSDEEVKYAEGLRRWWNLLDEKSMDKIDKVSRKITEASKEHKEP